MGFAERTGMTEACHRCGAELPTREWAGEGGFFCPHCGAPQILLPEHMRMEQPEAEAAAATSTVVPPPLPREVHWRTALRYGALVAVVGGVLTGLGMVSGVASFFGFLWVVSGGVIVLGFYQKQKPAARMSVGVGFRIGVVTGLLMTAALAVALGSAGVVARFGVHRMTEFDAQVQGFEGQMTERMRDQKQSAEVQAEAQRLMGSVEVRGGVAVVYLGLLGGVLVLVSAGGGAFAGMVGTRRQSARRMP
jgi:predicted RNA-binding Zn-ribbon protein involved in translation (DUF1610 family)